MHEVISQVVLSPVVKCTKVNFVVLLLYLSISACLCVVLPLHCIVKLYFLHITLNLIASVTSFFADCTLHLSQSCNSIYFISNLIENEVLHNLKTAEQSWIEVWVSDPIFTHVNALCDWLFPALLVCKHINCQKTTSVLKYMKTLNQELFEWMTFIITKAMVSYSSSLSKTKFSSVSLLSLTQCLLSLILVLLVDSDTLLFMAEMNQDLSELFTTYSLWAPGNSQTCEQSCH